MTFCLQNSDFRVYNYEQNITRILNMFLCIMTHSTDLLVTGLSCILCFTVFSSLHISGSVVLDDILVNIFRLLRRFYSADNDRQLASNTQMSTYKLGQSLDIRLDSKSTSPTW